VVTDEQVFKMSKQLAKHGGKTKAALQAGMDPKTGLKFRKVGALPSEQDD
jgi:hypothetical protein